MQQLGLQVLSLCTGSSSLFFNMVLKPKSETSTFNFNGCVSLQLHTTY